MTKILVTGASGLVGSRVVELNRDQFEFVCPEYPQFDLLNNDNINTVLSEYNPDWIIHLAAFTDVNASETQSGDHAGPAWQTNVIGTEKLSNIANIGSKFIHISTDMVFSGATDNPGPYQENKAPETDPQKLSWYGWTKNQAEQVVKRVGGTIVRINYPIRLTNSGKLDYIHSPLKKFKENTLHPLFSDQQVGITYIDELASSLAVIVSSSKSGIFHISSSNVASPYDIITYTLSRLGQDISSIQKSSIIDYLSLQKNKYRYPVMGGLSCQQTEKELGIKFKTWQQTIDELIANGLNLASL